MILDDGIPDITSVKGIIYNKIFNNYNILYKELDL